MVQIRIRKADNDAVALGEVPLTQEALDGVIPLIARWGVSDEGGADLDVKTLVGQFVVTPTEAYFEVIFAPEGSEL